MPTAGEIAADQGLTADNTSGLPGNLLPAIKVGLNPIDIVLGIDILHLSGSTQELTHTQNPTIVVVNSLGHGQIRGTAGGDRPADWRLVLRDLLCPNSSRCYPGFVKPPESTPHSASSCRVSCGHR